MKKETVKYQSANLIRYTADAFFYPFYALFLASIGKTESQIGIVLMIIPLISIFINPLWNLFAKNVNYNKHLAVLFSVVEAIAIVSLLAFTNLLTIIIITIILGAVNQPFYTLFESFTAVYTMETKESYSAIRLFGSLGYAIGVLISGLLIRVTGKYIASFFTVFGLYLLVAFILMAIKPLQTSPNELENKGKLKELFHNKSYLLFFGFYVITVSSLFTGDAFWGTYFKTKGIDEALFGFISLGVYLLEVICLILLSKFGNKIKIKNIMIFIALTNALRFFIYSFNSPIWLLAISSFLRGFTMAGILYVVVRYLSLYVKKENITLGMIMFGSAKNALQMAFTLSGGFIIERVSYNAFFFIVGIIGIISLVFIKSSKTTKEYDIIIDVENEG